jgi:hypothetical protein
MDSLEWHRGTMYERCNEGEKCDLYVYTQSNDGILEWDYVGKLPQCSKIGEINK